VSNILGKNYFKFANLIARFIIYLVVFLFTVYIYLNTYELVFLKDIEFIPAITSFSYLNSGLGQGFIIPNQSLNFAGGEMGDYGELSYLRIPSFNKKIGLLKGVKAFGNFIIFTNHAHYLVQFYPDGTRVRTLLLYINKSWRTLDHPERISRGTNLLIDTKRGWTYLFKVEDVQLLTFSQKYVFPLREKPSLIILIQDKAQKRVFVVRGEYRTVINKEI